MVNKETEIPDSIIQEATALFEAATIARISIEYTYPPDHRLIPILTKWVNERRAIKILPSSDDNMRFSVNPGAVKPQPPRKR